MPVQLAKPRAEVAQLIQRLHDEGWELFGQGCQIEDRWDHLAYSEWVRDTERWHARGREALHVAYATDKEGDEFYDAVTGALIRRIGQSDSEAFQYRMQAVRRGTNTLQSLKERLEFAVEPSVADVPVPGRVGPAVGRGVFVVHGHDDALREQVVRTLEKLQLDPIVLFEAPSGGQTLIEKFEHHATEAGYAVVLLTADDCGHAAGTNAPSQPNRARQNVILELGYFMGRLGRPYVCAIYEPGVELPSDIQGIVYVELAGDWRMSVAKELRAAGFDIDANKLI
jgi:predicted nucleotide-binding protein